MNENKKMWIVLSIIFALVLSIVLFVVIGNKKSKEIYISFEQKFNSENVNLVYIGSSKCGYCNLLNPSLEDMASRYEFEYTYINTQDLNSTYLTKISEKLGLASISTPYLAIVKDGKVLAEQKGLKDYDKTFEFLQKNNIIDKDAKLLLNYIDYKEFNELKAKKDLNVIVFGKSTCIYCVYAKNVLNDIVEDKNVKINYVNLSDIEQNDNANYKELITYLNKELVDWGTPTMIITKNNKIIDVLGGLATEANYISFFEENGVL